MEPIFDEINQEMKKINDVIAPIQNLTKQGIPVTTADELTLLAKLETKPTWEA